MRNVTPVPAQRARQNRIILIAVVVVLVVLIAKACAGGGENRYEKIADGMTHALAANDLAGVEKYQNAETATEVNRQRVGQAADVLDPLGKLKRVKEVTPAGDGDRVHEFDLTFDKGTVHEKMKLDPQDKVVRFAYDVVSSDAPK